MKKKSGFKMKAGKEGPMRKNFPSAFKKKPTKEELIAQADKFGDVNVSGGKKTKPGSFVQYPSPTGGKAESRGASVAGSSKEHTKLRDKSRDPNYKMTSKERARLTELNLLTEKAYKDKKRS